MLGLDSLPFERDYGCFWADRFRSEANVISNNGTPGGGNEAYGYDGLVLDGTANTYIDYDITNRLNKDSLTIVCEFTPNYNWNFDGGGYLFDSDTDGTATQRILAIKDNLANNYNFYLNMGGALLTINTIYYSSLWRANERNILVLKGTAGSGITAHLNGTEIGTNGTGFVQRTYTNMRIGARENNPAQNRLDATIHSLKIYNTEITDEDAVAISSNLVYNPLSSALAYWPMGSTSLLTDIIGGYNLTATGSPTKLSGGRGYYLDGSNDYFTATNLEIATGSFAVAFLFGMGSHDGLSNAHYYNKNRQTIFSTALYSGNVGGVHFLTNLNGNMYGEIGKVDSSSTAYSTGIKPWPEEHFIGISWDGTNGWLVFNDIVVSSSSAEYANTGRDLQIGHGWLNAADTYHRGDIYQGAVWRTSLTPMQMLRAKWDFKRTRRLAA